MAGIILDAVAVPNLLHHRHVGFGAAFYPLRFQEFLFFFEFLQLAFHFLLNSFKRPIAVVRRRDEVLGRRDIYFRQFRRLARPKSLGRLHLVYFIDSTVSYLEVINNIAVRRHYFPIVAPHAESRPFQVGVRPVELELYELFDEFIALQPIAGLQMEDVFAVCLRRTQAVDAGN